MELPEPTLYAIGEVNGYQTETIRQRVEFFELQLGFRDERISCITVIFSL
jgi:hypothetical protein